MARDYGKGRKFTHEEVAYGPSKPGGDKCMDCAHFNRGRASDRCDIVEDPIAPRGWCRKFQEK